MATEVRWKVLWTKEGHKKKPRWTDGVLLIDSKSAHARLYLISEDDVSAKPKGSCLESKTLSKSELQCLEEGEDITFESLKVQPDSRVDDDCAEGVREKAEPT